ncbi:MAG: transglutaminase family protein [Boseongicola sp.]|nr:transglutaminase family protein [Boseongicola sp.]MDD9978099.1 transglutaminase family protein [Boseongicola sp.]
MKIHTKHITRYKFSDDVQFGLQQVRKTPKSTRQQNVLSWETRIKQGKKELSYEDHHRNTVELVSFETGTTELVIASEGVVELQDTHGIVGPHQGHAPLWLYLQSTERTKAGPGCKSLTKALSSEKALDQLHELSSGIKDAVQYKIGASQPDWSAEKAISEGVGVCQDHTHIFLACARSMNIPARYVSGYLMLDDRTVQDAMHAWAEAHVDGLGWVGFDVSNGISPDLRYVRVATGLDYSDAAPISGARIGGDSETLHVEISVAQQ